MNEPIKQTESKTVEYWREAAEALFDNGSPEQDIAGDIAERVMTGNTDTDYFTDALIDHDLSDKRIELIIEEVTEVIKANVEHLRAHARKRTDEQLN